MLLYNETRQPEMNEKTQRRNAWCQRRRKNFISSSSHGAIVRPRPSPVPHFPSFARPVCHSPYYPAVLFSNKTRFATTMTVIISQIRTASTVNHQELAILTPTVLYRLAGTTPVSHP